MFPLWFFHRWCLKVEKKIIQYILYGFNSWQAWHAWHDIPFWKERQTSQAPEFCPTWFFVFKGWITIWVFPKIGIPQNGWFIMENFTKMGWFGGTPIFGTTHIPIPFTGWVVVSNIFLMFTRIPGENDPMSLIFFRWVETWNHQLDWYIYLHDNHN